MSGLPSNMQSNVVPLPRRKDAFVPVSLPPVSREQWEEFFDLQRLAMAILQKNRPAVAESAREMAAMHGDDADGLSAFMSGLNGSAEQLETMAAVIKSAGARLALASGREQEWLSLQDDQCDDVSA